MPPALLPAQALPTCRVDRCRTEAPGSSPSSPISTLGASQCLRGSCADRRRRESLPPQPTWQRLLGAGQDSPVLVPRPVQRPASNPFPSSLGGPSAVRDLRARESPGPCQPRYITAPRKEITIDPTALLPMLFAGTAKDSRASWAPTRSPVPAPDGQTNTLWLPLAPARGGSDVTGPGFF